MTMLIYVGPHDGVDVPIHATGQTITALRGDKVDIPRVVAEGLLKQGEEHWKRAPAARKRKGE